MYVEYVDSLVGPATAESKVEISSASPGSPEGFEVTRDGKMRIIKINKPDKKNALSTAMYLSVSQVII